jgi:predicted aldo/keto reductase-like oxidoreductase
LNRRRFLECGAAGLAGAAGLFRVRLRGETAAGGLGPLPRRELGRTGERLSVVGLGGMALAREPQADVDALVREAFEAGVNYFDVAPSYGNAEDVLGPALEPFRRNVFLACKTLARDAAGAAAELETSLRKLRTDHVDLYQFHALKESGDVDKILGPGGAMETFARAKREGKIRFIGFSAHDQATALLAMDRFAFDTVLFPVNYVCWHAGGFGPAAVDKAREKGLGILALKALARTSWKPGETRTGCIKCWYEPILDPAEQALSLRFTLSRPVTAAVPPGDPTLFRRAVALAGKFSPLTMNEEAELKRRAEGLAPIFSAKKPE